MPFVQITNFVPSAAQKSGSVSLKELLVQSGRPAGLKDAYLGSQTDGSMFFWVSVWGSKADHDSTAKCAGFSEAQAACRPAFASPPVMNYVEVDGADKALGAPVTEIVTLTLKNGKTVAELEVLVQELHRGLQGKCHGSSWGPASGKTNVYHGIVGSGQGNVVTGSVIEQIKLIADVQVARVKLEKL